MEFIHLTVLIIWVLGIFLYKKNSNYALIPAFFLFLASVFFVVINLVDVAEQIARISFIGWIVGVTWSLIEYIKLKKI